jgi:hypothetical protein
LAAAVAVAVVDKQGSALVAKEIPQMLVAVVAVVVDLAQLQTALVGTAVRRPEEHLLAVLVQAVIMAQFQRGVRVALAAT